MTQTQTHRGRFCICCGQWFDTPQWAYYNRWCRECDHDSHYYSDHGYDYRSVCKTTGCKNTRGLGDEARDGSVCCQTCNDHIDANPIRVFGSPRLKDENFAWHARDKSCVMCRRA